MLNQCQYKTCRHCGANFYKKARHGHNEWADRLYCSKVCSNRANALKNTKSIEERFWKNVSRGSKNDCWLWMGAKDQNGYGVTHLGQVRAKKIKAHRLSYKLSCGELVKGFVIMHLCDNPSCVNPDHLKQGTQKQNMQDCSRKGRLNSKSFLNLKPGAKGFLGAGPKSNKEIVNAKQM